MDQIKDHLNTGEYQRAMIARSVGYMLKFTWLTVCMYVKSMPTEVKITWAMDQRRESILLKGYKSHPTEFRTNSEYHRCVNFILANAWEYN